MLRALLVVASVLVAVAPVGVGVGVALAVSLGWGVSAASVAYGAVGVWLLTADLVPGESPREVVR